MKGILIIGFNKSPGAYIDHQYPEEITEKLNITTADLMNVYALHRMRQMQPNYITIKIKNIPIVSFYSGFSFKHYVGKPDFAITIILSPNDNPNEDYEGYLRRVAFELLPKRESMEFEDMLFDYFEDLKARNIEPYFEEYKEGEGSTIATIENGLAEEKDDVQKMAEENLKINDLSFDKQFELMAKEELKEEIEELKKQIQEKNEKIKEFSQKFTDKLQETSSTSQADILKLHEELAEKNQKIDEWSSKLADISEKNFILMETVKKLTEMSAQQTDDMEKQGQKIIDLEKTITEKDKLIEEISNNFLEAKGELDKIKTMPQNVQPEPSEVQTASSETEAPTSESLDLDSKSRYVETIAKLKTELKTKEREKQELKTTIDMLKTEILTFKKDNKIFRREIDHYKEIIKEHDLL